MLPRSQDNERWSYKPGTQEHTGLTARASDLMVRAAQWGSGDRLLSHRPVLCPPESGCVRCRGLCWNADRKPPEAQSPSLVTDGEESSHAAGAPLLRWVPAGQQDGNRHQGCQVRSRSPGHMRERADAPATGSGPVLIHSLTSLEPLLNARHHDDLREVYIQRVRGVVGVIKRQQIMMILREKKQLQRTPAGQQRGNTQGRLSRGQILCWPLRARWDSPDTVRGVELEMSQLRVWGEGRKETKCVEVREHITKGFYLILSPTFTPGPFLIFQPLCLGTASLPLFIRLRRFCQSWVRDPLSRQNPMESHFLHCALCGACAPGDRELYSWAVRAGDRVCLLAEQGEREGLACQTLVCLFVRQRTIEMWPDFYHLGGISPFCSESFMWVIFHHIGH